MRYCGLPAPHAEAEKVWQTHIPSNLNAVRRSFSPARSCQTPRGAFFVIGLSVAKFDGKDRFTEKALGVFQPRTTRRLTAEDARQITANLTGFFRVLSQWAANEAPEKSSQAPDAAEADASTRSSPEPSNGGGNTNVGDQET